jgi:protein-S-isoprenylcysteine O-methyltransferase Ste14
MNNLTREAFTRLLSFIVILALLLFLAAGTIHYWQAWIFLAVFSAAVLMITSYLVKNDPKLLERRLSAGPGAEKERNQNLIQFLAMIAFLSVLVVPAIDHRYRWSTMPPYVVAIGDILVVLGFLIVFLVFKENTYTSATIEVASEQRVIATGPYAHVRHPMYIGALVMLLGVPLALGSWWGLLTIIPMTVVITWRLLEEEKFLARNLSGYSEYRNKVRSRLVPLVW